MRLLFLLIVIICANVHSVLAKQDSISWEEIKKSKKGRLSVVWFPNGPFGFKDANGKMKGIEVEIMEGFQKYLQDRYHIVASLVWIQEETFNDVLVRIKNESKAGVFGLAGFSFSDERRTFMKFSPSYMADIAVLVSTPDIPIVRSTEDLKEYLTGTTALTAQGTLLEKELIRLRDKNEISFNIEYTGGSKELISVLNTRRKSFGYINLPVYLMNLDKGVTKLNRQNYLTKRYEGRGVGLPKSSDWDVPLSEYFASEGFQKNIESIIANYVNLDLYRFIETFDPVNEVSLLNKEKDIQQIQLKAKELEIQDKNQKQIYLIIIISIVTILLFIIVVLFRKQIDTHRLLNEQKAEIEAQSDEIVSINENLEQTIRERTRELENKNKALAEYAFITAHKLRAPLASILGLVTLAEKIKLSEEDKVILLHLNHSAKKLDEVVHSVMDAIDGSDSQKPV